MRPNAQLVEVQLVEEDTPDDAAASTVGPMRTTVSGVMARLPRRTRRVLSGLLVTVLVVLPVQQSASVAARTARLNRTVGLSVPLDQPLQETWRARAWQPLGTVGGALLLRRQFDNGVAAIDIGTGEERYSVTGWCDLVPHTSAAPDVTPIPVLARDDLLVCDHAAAAQRDLPAGAPRTTPMTVHDPFSGRVVHRLEVRTAGSPVRWNQHAGGYSVDRDGHLVAELWSLRTGDPVWSYRSSDPVHLPAAALDEAANSRPNVSSGSLGTVARFLGVDREMELQAGIAASPVGRGSSVTLADGTRLDREAGRTTVFSADRDVRFTAPGRLLVPDVDDGTAPTVHMWSYDGDDAVAVDAVTGEQRWSAANVSTPQCVMKLAGVILIRHDDGISALDPHTGRLRWAAPPSRYAGGSHGMVADSRTVLTVENGVDGWHTAFVARDVHTGAEKWTSPIPHGGTVIPAMQGITSLHRLLDGTVLISSVTGMFVALR